MLATTALARPNTSLVTLRRELKSITGETCRRVDFTYGHELRVHIGEQLETGISKPARAKWLLTARATPWEVRIGRRTVPWTTKSVVKLDRVRSLEGRIVTRFAPTRDFGLTVNFDGNAALRLIPPASPPRTNDLPYWELFTPDHTVLIVGPGRQWQLVPSETSMSTLPRLEGRQPNRILRRSPGLVSIRAGTVANLRDLIEELIDEGRRLKRLLARARERPVRSRLRYLESKWKRLEETLPH